MMAEEKDIASPKRRLVIVCLGNITFSEGIVLVYGGS